MNKNFSEISKEVLSCFISAGRVLINTGIDPYGVVIYGEFGRPKKYYNAVNNLKRRGYLKSKKMKNRMHYILTKKGERTAREMLLEKKIKKKKWDKRWRVLIFDIPESKRRFRDNIRKSLREIGFYQLQKSVWVFPYDVLDYLYAIVPGFREGDWFEYIEAIKISSQEILKKYFNLD